MTDSTDDLEPLLAPRPGVARPIAFREELFQRTTRRLTVARRSRRLRSVAAIAAVFLLGGSLGWFLKPMPESVTIAAPEPIVIAVGVPVPVSMPTAPDVAEVAAIPSPDQTEMQAELADDANEAARLYRLAGDRYLNDRDDYANALRCYRLYLRRAGDAGLTSVAEDSWLLTSLKNAAFQDKAFAAKG